MNSLKPLRPMRQLRQSKKVQVLTVLRRMGILPLEFLRSSFGFEYGRFRIVQAYDVGA
jgi:hypothetical protein